MIDKPTKAYFDNAATTFVKPKQVHDFMHDFYAANSINIGRGNHVLQGDGQRIITETRKMLLELFAANSEYTAVLTASATEALNVILQGQDYKQGQTIYISPFEHNAVYRTVKFLEKEKGIIVKELAVDKETLEFSFDKIRRQFSDNKPTLVIVSHISNVCGNIAPINEIGKLAKSSGAVFVVDTAQSAGLVDISIGSCYADYIVFAGHKTLYGPFGCSGFICKKSTKLKPLIYGGIGIDSANETMPLDAPTKFEAGSYNIMAIAGLHAALTWRKSVGAEPIRKKEKENCNKLLNILSNADGIEIIGNTKNSISIISCLFDECPPNMIENILSKQGIIVRSGLHCAPQAHKFLGSYPAGTVRFSVSYFTKEEDFKQLEEVLDEF